VGAGAWRPAAPSPVPAERGRPGVRGRSAGSSSARGPGEPGCGPPASARGGSIV